ncbi:MAG: hypothetical protein RL745_362 [Actinomycetota bacterium]
MAFGLTPAGSGFPPQAADAFPNYIQFQYEGVDLGLPDIDTVDFQGSVFVSRGDGENSNKVTVVVGSNPSTPTPSGAQPLMAFRNSGSGGGNGINAWTAVSLVADATVAQYTDSTNRLVFASPGVYKVTIATRATVDALSQIQTITVSSPTGSVPDAWTEGSRHYVSNLGTQLQFDFVDVFLLDMQAGDLTRSFQVTTDNAEGSLSVALAVEVVKLS